MMCHRVIGRVSLGFLLLAAGFAFAARVSADPAGPGKAAAGSSSRVVGIIVKLADAPVAAYDGTVTGLLATRAAARAGRGLDRRDPAVQAYRAHLASKHAAFEATVRAATPAARVTHRFDVVLGGLAMRLPEDQIAAVAQLPGVVAVYRDPVLRLHTDTSPQFIGAAPVWGRLQGHERAGEDVIIGVIDTGIWPEHPSFSDPDPSGRPYSAPAIAPERCDFAGGANPGAPFACNNKLIGAYRFMAAYDLCVADGGCELRGDFTSARDSDGHGTHTASIAAGNPKVHAEIFGIDRKQVSGVAPRARLIAYKVCGPDFCFGSDSIAAVQQAVVDGVQVLNFSISGGVDPYADPVELAFLDAYAAGVFVAASAGNEGPEPDTVNHRGPWVTSIAASTESRSFQATLALAAADGAILRLPGVSITPGIPTPLPLIVLANDAFCDADAPADLGGFFVVCARGGVTGRLEKSFNVAARGGAGMILVNSAEGEELLTDNHSVPSIHIAKSAGDALAAFRGAHPGVTGTLAVGVARNAPGDVLARFSSRGGTAPIFGISKPDITAPGLQILGAHTPEPADPANPPGQLFQAIAGTSMSSPHVAGAAALLAHLHPDWSPGQIKSALMMTAWTAGLVREDGETPVTPFDVGSGRVNLQDAQAPGLTFEAPAADYASRADELWAVNHPSIYVPDVAADQLVVQRTARSVATRDTTWAVSVVPDSAPGLLVTVPPTLTVPAGGTASFDVAVDKTGIPAGAARHAVLRLASSETTLHLPITAAGRVDRPDLVVTEVSAPATGTRGEPFLTAVTVRNTGAGAAPRFIVQVYLSRDDATLSTDDTPYWFCIVGSLAAGASHSCNFDFAIPSGLAAGTYFVIVRVDDALAVFESDEGNNMGADGPIAIE